MLHQQGISLHPNTLAFANSSSSKCIGPTLGDQAGIYATSVPSSSSQEQLSSSSSVSSTKVDHCNQYASAATEQSSDIFNKFTVYSSTTTTSTSEPMPASSTVVSSQPAYNSDPYQQTSSTSSYSSYQIYPLAENIPYDYYSSCGGGHPHHPHPHPHHHHHQHHQQQHQNLQATATSHQHDSENGWQLNSGLVISSGSHVPANSFASFQGHHQAIANSMPVHQNHHQYQMILHGMQ